MDVANRLCLSGSLPGACEQWLLHSEHILPSPKELSSHVPELLQGGRSLSYSATTSGLRPGLCILLLSDSDFFLFNESIGKELCL